MKAYVKPAMMALSISANDQLCGSCTFSTRENKDIFSIYLTIPKAEWNDDGDGILEPGESAIFGHGEDCDFEYAGYCKHAAVKNGSEQVFTS